jgi:hypothetical protein
MAGAGNIGGLGMGVVGGGLGAPLFSVRTAVSGEAFTQQASAPSVTVNISPEARSLLSQIARVGGAASANPVNTGMLANTLVDVAVIAAVLDDSKDENRKKFTTALIVSAALQAYQQVANLPGVNILTPVLGMGTNLAIRTGA